MSGVRVLADEYWEYYRDTAQLWNVDRGDVDEIEKWEDLSGSGVSERVRRLGEFRERARRSTRVDTDDQDMSLLASVSFSAGATASLLPWMRNRGLVGGPFNFAEFLSVLVPGYGLVTRGHGEGYVAKLKGIPAFIDGWVDGLRAGLTVGQNATGRGVAKAVADLDRLLHSSASRDPLVGQVPPSEFDDAEVDTWRKRGDCGRP